MTDKILELGEIWNIGPRIGDVSGMGTVYRATNQNGQDGAIKFIPKVPGAQRELLFEELSGAPNIVPIIDRGETETDFIIVMPLAECSLRAHIREMGGKLSVMEAVEVLKQVAAGLASLEATVVHRDLKPENILLLDGQWCIADFGIARYAEAATAEDTKKFAMTWPYAAPEQWRHEHATPRTDIYALGVIAFELVNGRRPYNGPDYRDQHLNQTAPLAGSGFLGLDSLITDCLRKSPGVRPAPNRFIERLDRALVTSQPAIERLQEVDQRIGIAHAEEDAKMSKIQDVLSTRKSLFNDSKDIFGEFIRNLKDEAQRASPRIHVEHTGASLSIRLEQGELKIDDPMPVGIQALGSQSGPHQNLQPFDVVAYSSILLEQSSTREGRSHSLWFCDAHNEGEYRWFEMSFMWSPLKGRVQAIDPFSLPPSGARIAFQRTIGEMQLSWKPMPMDQDQESEFIERWFMWLAQAAEGRYQKPRVSPDEPHDRRGWYRNA